MEFCGRFVSRWYSIAWLNRKVAKSCWFCECNKEPGDECKETFEIRKNCQTTHSDHHTSEILQWLSRLQMFCLREEIDWRLLDEVDHTQVNEIYAATRPSQPPPVTDPSAQYVGVHDSNSYHELKTISWKMWKGSQTWSPHMLICCIFDIQTN